MKFEDLDGCHLVAWRGLSPENLNKVFPGSRRLDGELVGFDSAGIDVYQLIDAAGNSVFAFDKGQGLTSHGSQILSNQTMLDLHLMGAEIS